MGTEFSSFDVLWFDLNTKVREVVGELVHPIVERSYANMGKIKEFEKTIATNRETLAELKAVVYNKTEGLDVFNEINTRISEIETEFKTVTQR